VDSVIPASAQVGTPVAVVIRGSGFLARAVERLTGAPLEVDDVITVQVGDLTLSDTVRVSSEELHATVPGSLPVGAYDVTVINAYGRAATRSGGFRVETLMVSDGGAGGGTAGGGTAGGGTAGGGTAGGGTAGGGTAGGGTAGGGVEISPLFTDPFGDATTGTFVFGHDGQVYVGPNKSGAGVMRFNPDGTSPQTIALSIPRDMTGNSASNTATPPYTSVGTLGCAHNTQACGPDNEDGRALFIEATIADAGWLVAGGAKVGQSMQYVYMSSDTGTLLGLRYVDLSSNVGAGTCQLSSAISLADRVYLGFGGTAGARRPGLVVLTVAPLAPGLDPSATEAIDLKAEQLPNINNDGGATNNIMLDAMGVLNGRLYLGAYGGWVRSTVATPGPAGGAGSADWADCTPTAAAYGAKTSTTTTKRSELEPADKALPAFAEYGGRLYAARNTTTGPQLFACAPALSGTTTDCDPGDWSLVAPNSTGDPQLTQFNDAANTRITLLQSTPAALYVGFNNATSGVVVFRSSAAAPASRADFTGRFGCTAALYPASCQGYGGDGLGAGPTLTHIYDSVALAFMGNSYLYVAAGDGTAPVRVLRVEP
jgi:hypothetical protein